MRNRGGGMRSSATPSATPTLVRTTWAASKHNRANSIARSSTSTMPSMCGFTDTDHLINDEHLKPLHGDPRFDVLIQRTTRNRPHSDQPFFDSSEDPVPQWPSGSGVFQESVQSDDECEETCEEVSVEACVTSSEVPQDTPRKSWIWRVHVDRASLADATFPGAWQIHIWGRSQDVDHERTDVESVNLNTCG